MTETVNGPTARKGKPYERAKDEANDSEQASSYVEHNNELVVPVFVPETAPKGGAPQNACQ